MDLVNYLKNSEQPIYDFNTPWSMAIVVLGFLSAWLVTTLFEHLGLTRHVCDLPLVFAALTVLFGSLIVLFFAPLKVRFTDIWSRFWCLLSRQLPLVVDIITTSLVPGLRTDR